MARLRPSLAGTMALFVLLLPLAAPSPALAPALSPALWPGLGQAARPQATSGRVSSAAFPKWAAAMRRELARRVARGRRCAAAGGADCDPPAWRLVPSTAGSADPLLLIEQVNRRVNEARYRSDSSAWGEEDYWAAPDELFARGGDCEDYAIAKYYALKSLGVPIEAMRIVVLNDRRRKVAHAVLAVRTGARELVLDNLESRPLSWRDLPHYRPVYAVNERHYWVSVDTGTARAGLSRTAAAPAARL